MLGHGCGAAWPSCCRRGDEQCPHRSFLQDAACFTPSLCGRGTGGCWKGPRLLLHPCTSAGVHAGAVPSGIPELPAVRELGAATPLPACSLPARKLLLMKFSPHFPSLSCVVRNALPAPVSLALPPRPRPACLYLRVASNLSWQLQAHFQISLELLCRRLGFQALRCRRRQTRHLHPLDGTRPRCLLCPVSP